MKCRLKTVDLFPKRSIPPSLSITPQIINRKALKVFSKTKFRITTKRGLEHNHNSTHYEKYYGGILRRDTTEGCYKR